MRSLFIFAVLPSLTFYGCGVSDRELDGSVVRDSSGVEIVVNSAALSTKLEGWSLAALPELRIGSIDDSLYQFDRISSVRRLPDARIVVANRGTLDIRFYDRAGTFISRVGRGGGGPGEFRAIERIAMVQDSIWVSDPRLRRVSLLTLDGEYARSFSLSASPNLVLPRLLGVFSDGSLLVEVDVPDASPATGIQPIRSKYYHLDRTGTILDTLGEFETGQHLVQRGERGASSVRLPFARTASVAVAGNRFYYGSGERYEASLYSSAGLLDRIIRRNVEPRSISSQDLDQYIASLAKLIPDPSAYQRLKEMYRSTPLPAAMPAYLAFLTDSEDRLWVQEHRILGDSLPLWSVFDKGGAYMGTIQLPARFTLHEVGSDFLLGVRVDDADVEYIELYRFARKLAHR